MTDQKTGERSGRPLRVALLGAGRIGSSHAELLAHRLPGVELAAIVDPVIASATRLAEELHVPVATADLDGALDSHDIDAVVITSPARHHTELVVAAASAGRHVFVEKPMALTLADADRAISAAAKAGVVLQVGFNRRFARGFAEAREAVAAGRIGVPQLLRSLTRDPGSYRGDPSATPRWTIFYETLIHDFDTLCFLNPDARPVRVTALADALIRPDARGSGHLDTAVVTIEFDNGAIAVAEASFSALYGYDVRGEVFGSAGMVTMGGSRTSDMTVYTADGMHAATSRLDSELLRDAYRAELEAFVRAARTGDPSPVPGQAARTALSIALACILSVTEERPVDLKEVL